MRNKATLSNDPCPVRRVSGFFDAIEGRCFACGSFQLPSALCGLTCACADTPWACAREIVEHQLKGASCETCHGELTMQACDEKWYTYHSSGACSCCTPGSWRSLDDGSVSDDTVVGEEA
jgi:hypothetical protein